MSTLTLAVCPHDTVKNPEGWYRLVQYLTRKLDIDIHFEMSMDFGEFRSILDIADLAFANPTDCYYLKCERNFTPITRPVGTYDEAVFITGTTNINPSLSALHGATIATVKRLLPTKIALRMLRQQGIVPDSFVDCDSWMSVVRSVWQGDAPYGIVYGDSYDDLSESAKSMVTVFGRSNEQSAFHCFSVGPQAAYRINDFQHLLLEMEHDDGGREVLEDLHISGWQTVTENELVSMQQVISSHVT